jgi:hypothetical protein
MVRLLLEPLPRPSSSNAGSGDGLPATTGHLRAGCRRPPRASKTPHVPPNQLPQRWQALHSACPDQASRRP